MNTVAALLAQARQLGLASVDARLLLSHVSGLNHAHQAGRPETELDDAQAAQYRELLARRSAGEPIAYLIGEREFFSLRFEVGPGVLIPRPDTELLVELALERLPLDTPLRVLDLGTGSGILPVCLAKHRPAIAMSAVDVSPAALAIAARNVLQHGVTVRLLQSDWYTALGDETFDLIVSNPPYIANGDHHLDEGDLRFEPRSALTDEADGLAHIRQIINGATTRLHPGGWLLFEHGYDQAAASRALLVAAGFAQVQSWGDLGGNDRVSGGIWRA
ncbi:peptide chain release factor N(5)-glutamine methyltransferase [Chitinimonas sp. BJYL2]|uniref:peptide chain release factor N(5)-glutamine methyltransferase n=1 Tax=Chitinimonas sp. BJYL2 TaxID=2976696 RepID=UPI0022B35F93|nr:peptide chain release factor N(5)-glutamine methyltransferase [Chitinimonas sp. BJYL2]